VDWVGWRKSDPCPSLCQRNYASRPLCPRTDSLVYRRINHWLAVATKQTLFTLFSELYWPWLAGPKMKITKFGNNKIKQNKLKIYKQPRCVGVWNITNWRSNLEELLIDGAGLLEELQLLDGMGVIITVVRVHLEAFLLQYTLTF